MAEIEDEVLDQDSKAGVVMIDDEYYFKIQARQYVFGKIKVVADETSKNYGKPFMFDLLYPTTISGVFKQYFKHKQVDLTSGKRLTIEELLKVVNEIRKTIDDIESKLQVNE